MNLHRLAEERSIAYHRAVANLIRIRPEILDTVRRRVEAAIAAGGRSAHHAERWREILGRPHDEIVAFLVDPSEEARELRQSTPFAGLLEPRERWRIWRETRESFAAGA